MSSAERRMYGAARVRDTLQAAIRSGREKGVIAADEGRVHDVVFGPDSTTVTGDRTAVTMAAWFFRRTPILTDVVEEQTAGGWRATARVIPG